MSQENAENQAPAVAPAAPESPAKPAVTAAEPLRFPPSTPRVITGLDALSRNADRERMMMFLSDVAMLDNINPDTRLKLRETNIISDMAAGAGVERGKYVASKEEIEAAQQQRQQTMLNQQAEAAAIDAAATNVTKGNEQ